MKLTEQASGREDEAGRSGEGRPTMIPCINCGGLSYFTSPEMEDYFTRTKKFNRRWFPCIDEERYEAANEAERDQMDAEYEVGRLRWSLMLKIRRVFDPAPDKGRDDPDHWPCPVCEGYGRQTLDAAKRTLTERKMGLRW